MTKTILGLKTRACVNGLSIEDFDNVKKIPTMEEDITDLQSSKQDVLTFDNAPTASSTNPVTSDGIKTYVDNAVAGGGDDWVEIDVSTYTSANSYVNDLFNYDQENDEYTLKYDMRFWYSGITNFGYTGQSIYDCFIEPTSVATIANSSRKEVLSSYIDFNYIFFVQSSENYYVNMDTTGVLFDTSDNTFSFIDRNGEVSRTESCRIWVKGYTPSN